MKHAHLILTSLLFSACTFVPNAGDWEVTTKEFSTDTCGIEERQGNNDDEEILSLVLIDNGVSFPDLDADCVLEKPEFTCGETVDESPVDESNTILVTISTQGSFGSVSNMKLNVAIGQSCDGPDCESIEAELQAQIDSDPSQDGREFPCQTSIDYTMVHIAE